MKWVMSNLARRPIPTLLSISSIALMIALLLTVTGMTTGKLQEIGRRVQSVGADLIVQPEGASAFLVFSGAKLSGALEADLRAISGVAEVAPVLVVVEMKDGIQSAYGIDFPTYNRIGQPFKFVAGGPLEGDQDILLDVVKADSLNAHVGQPIVLFGRTFRVAGIVESGKGTRYFLPLGEAQKMTGSEQKVSLFFLQCDRPERAGSIQRQMEERFPDLTIRLLRDFPSYTALENAQMVRWFFTALTLLVGSVASLTILLTLYTAMLERSHQIAVLKSLGASTRFISGLVLQESAVLSLAGFLLGTLLTWGVRSWMSAVHPSLPILFSWDWVLKALALGLGSALLGGLYPALKANRMDPVDLLSQP
ncbi:MAG: ABC transporter permease [Acidobacteria bacterium]|nr:ABC transporter permease [Acidobacteriota bacterium]